MELVELYGPIANDIRSYMESEVQLDIISDRLYRSAYMTEDGWTRWPNILLEAIRRHDAEWLARRTRGEGLLPIRHNGRRVPITAPETLAEGEFNRFYCRAVCIAAAVHKCQVEVYRAKQVQVPRRQSQTLLGRLFPAETILHDLRIHIGVDLALGIPAGPNSGISLRLAK